MPSLTPTYLLWIDQGHVKCDYPTYSTSNGRVVRVTNKPIRIVAASPKSCLLSHRTPCNIKQEQPTHVLHRVFTTRQRSRQASSLAGTMCRSPTSDFESFESFPPGHRPVKSLQDTCITTPHDRPRIPTATAFDTFTLPSPSGQQSTRCGRAGGKLSSRFFFHSVVPGWGVFGVLEYFSSEKESMNTTVRGEIGPSTSYVGTCVNIPDLQTSGVC
jgi:hypothetical protein